MSRAFLAVMAGLFVVLTLASLIGWWLERRSSADNATIANLNARVRSWWVMVVVLALVFALGRVSTIVLFGLLSFVALREFWTLAPTRAGDQRALFWSFFIILPAQYILLGVGWYGLFAIFISVYAFLGLPALSTLAGDTHDFFARAARVQWGLMLCVYAISHAPALLILDFGGHAEALSLLLYLILVVQFSDVFQYVCGKLFGRHRLSPSISPSKTIEGLVGGGVAAVVLGVALTPMTPFTFWQSALVSAAVVIAGFFGGFVLSAIKRDLGAKDWGALIEGHGGALDRLDSLAFAAPVFFHIVRYEFSV